MQPVDTVEDRLSGDKSGGASLAELRDGAARDPVTNAILDASLHLSKAEQRALVQPVLGGPCRELSRKSGLLVSGFEGVPQSLLRSFLAFFFCDLDKTFFSSSSLWDTFK